MRSCFNNILKTCNIYRAELLESSTHFFVLAFEDRCTEIAHFSGESVVKEIPWQGSFAWVMIGSHTTVIKDMQENKYRRLQFLQTPLKEVTEICFIGYLYNVRKYTKICNAFKTVYVAEKYSSVRRGHIWLFL